jgi:hypothetical protein
VPCVPGFVVARRTAGFRLTRLEHSSLERFPKSFSTQQADPQIPHVLGRLEGSTVPRETRILGAREIADQVDAHHYHRLQSPADLPDARSRTQSDVDMEKLKSGNVAIICSEPPIIHE